MNIREQFPSAFLKCEDLGGVNHPVTIDRIESIEMADDNGKMQSKAVAYFKDRNSGLPLNKTNAFFISDLYGFETDGWIGKGLILRPDTTLLRGSTVACIRLSAPTEAPAPAPAAAPAQAATAPAQAAGWKQDDDVPF